jgi:hypothetical protein
MKLEGSDKIEKKEVTVRDVAWETVKKFHEKTKKDIQIEIEKGAKNGNVKTRVSYQNEEQARILARILSEDGYLCQVNYEPGEMVV